MENFETENSDYYESLRQEIANLKDEAMANKGKDPKIYVLHFDNIEPNSLTVQDLDIYKEYKEGSLTFEKFSEYQQSFYKVKNLNDPRCSFMAWLANKTSTREWIEKWRS